MSELTAKEIGILDLVAAGMSSKEISAKLNVSFHTVQTHRKNMMKKLGVRNAAELIAKTRQPITP